MIASLVLAAVTTLTAPLHVSVSLPSSTRQRFDAGDWSAACVPDTGHACALEAPVGPVEVTVENEAWKRPYRFDFDLPAGGAKVHIQRADTFARGEAYGMAIAGLIMGLGIVGLGYAVKSPVVKGIGFVYGGIGAVLLTVMVAAPTRPAPPEVYAENAAGQPLAVRAIAVAGTF